MTEEAAYVKDLERQLAEAQAEAEYYREGIIKADSLISKGESNKALIQIRIIASSSSFGRQAFKRALDEAVKKRLEDNMDYMRYKRTIADMKKIMENVRLD